MSSSSKKIPPLIRPPHRSTVKDDETEDLFATLFSPPTPPASPTPPPIFDILVPSTSRPMAHSRTCTNSASDFGSFVSVSALEDPLKLEQQEPFTPLHNLEFFEKFTDGAAKSNAQNKKVLEELLQHEDDPLYWLNENVSPLNPNGLGEKGKIHSGTATPISRTSSPQVVGSVAHTQVDNSPSLIDFEAQPIQWHHSRNQNASEPPVPGSSSSTFSRSPNFGSVTSRWLSSIRTPYPRVSSFTDNTSVTGFFDPPPHSNPLHQSTLSTSTSTSPQEIRRPLPEITHGTPFASQIYTPPSGAPGFSGDRHWNKSNFEFDAEGVNKKSVRLTGRKDITMPILTLEQADMIRPHLSALPRLATSWTLLYSLDQHGISLNTLYSRCMNHLGGALVVMKDSDEQIFGVWLGETVRPSKGAYYGSGESFLWKFTGHDDADRGSLGKLKVFKWTGKNDYITLCESEYLSFGGGDGKYGLYLDGSLLDGSSSWCPTFANEPLCSDAGHRQGDNVTFECVGLEVWGIGGT